MRIHVLSDVHLEFGKWPKSVDINRIDADVTVLAGDIGQGLQGFEWALQIDRPVVYVFGNHEFYTARPMLDLLRKAREKVTDTHVHLLDNDVAIINGVRFLGCTLWTDYALLGAERQDEAMRAAARMISDFSTVYVSRRGSAIGEPGYTTRHAGNLLTPRKALSLHHHSRDFLERELARPADPIADDWRQTVVVTHHAPSSLSLRGGEPAGLLDASDASPLNELAAIPDLWIHGHTHHPVDYRLGGGRVVSNPRGYVPHGLVPEFDPGFVIDLDENDATA